MTHKLASLFLSHHQSFRNSNYQGMSSQLCLENGLLQTQMFPLLLAASLGDPSGKLFVFLTAFFALGRKQASTPESSSSGWKIPPLVEWTWWCTRIRSIDQTLVSTHTLTVGQICHPLSVTILFTISCSTNRQAYKPSRDRPLAP